MYDIEMSEANKLIDGTKKDAAAANVKAQKAEQDLNRLRGRLNEVTSAQNTDGKNLEALQRQLAENEAVSSPLLFHLRRCFVSLSSQQIALFRRRIGDLEEEALRHKSHAQRILSEINRLQTEIQSERFLKTSQDVEKLALEDELKTLKAQRKTSSMFCLSSERVPFRRSRSGRDPCPSREQRSRSVEVLPQ